MFTILIYVGVTFYVAYLNGLNMFIQAFVELSHYLGGSQMWKLIKLIQIIWMQIKADSYPSVYKKTEIVWTTVLEHRVSSW